MTSTNTHLLVNITINQFVVNPVTQYTHVNLGPCRLRSCVLYGCGSLCGCSSLPVKERVIDSASPVYQAVNSSGEVLEPAEWARRAAHMQSKSFRLLAHITGTEYSECALKSSPYTHSLFNLYVLFRTINYHLIIIVEQCKK